MPGSWELCEAALSECHSALDEAEARYRTVLEHAPEAVVVLDVDAGRFVEANRKAVQLFELPRAALLDSNPIALSPPTQPSGAASPELAWERIQEALAGEAPTFEWVHRTSTGVDKPCEVRLVRLPAAGRRLVRGSVIDLSRRQRQELQLLQWQRVELLGRLAGGIAHDLNGVLQAIGAAAEAIRDAPPEALRLEAEWIRRAVGQGTRLTERLLRSLRAEAARPALVDLNALTRDTAELLERLLPARVRLGTFLEEPALVRANREELEQVLFNLVLNARDALPEGGLVTLSTRRLGNAVRLRVEDTGIGMDATTRERMFEAFFTTKPEGAGCGLGLAIVQAIVQRASGRLEVWSEPGRGTRIDVLLPSAGDSQ